MVLQELEPERDRVLAGGFGHLVQEGLNRVGGVGRSHGAPPEDRSPTSVVARN
jgi:hypothetical protein